MIHRDVHRDDRHLTIHAQLAGTATANGLLGPAVAGEWPVPDDLTRLASGRLFKWESSSANATASAPEGLLGAFLDLAVGFDGEVSDAQAEAVYRFALRHGVLCSWRLDDTLDANSYWPAEPGQWRTDLRRNNPLRIAGSHDLRVIAAVDGLLAPIHETSKAPPGLETAEEWLIVAALLRRLLQANVALESGDRESAARIMRWLPTAWVESPTGSGAAPRRFDTGTIKFMRGSTAGFVYPPETREVSGPLEQVVPELTGIVINQLIDLGTGAAVRFDPTSGFTATMRAESLIGAIGLQLGLTLRGGAKIASCSECDSLYEASRRPAAGRRNYCPPCSDGGAPERNRSQTYRDKKRKAKS